MRRSGSTGVPQQKVPRHPDALERDTAAAPDLHEEDRDRDRDAEPSIEHLIEVRVPRVVVGLQVSPHTEGLEDEPAYLPGVGRPDPGGHVIESGELRGDVDGFVGHGGNQQGALVEG